MVSGTNFSLKPEDEQNIITAAYQRFLNSLSFPIQIIIHSRKVNIDKYLQNLQQRQDKEASPLLQNQISEYSQFIESFVKENPIMSKSFFVAVPYHPKGLTLPPAGGEAKKEGGMSFPGAQLLSFLKRKKEEKKNDDNKEDGEDQKEKAGSKAQAGEDAAEIEFQQEFEKHLLQMKQRTTHVIQGIEAIGLQAKLLDDEQLIELYYNFYNPETMERKDINLPQESKDKK